ncbi:hypothetical protein HUJ04_004943 [Dendroctonus ponderosae]|nr:hypothetical protein HUJ04_004943 [Dendroctonus ponderosae]
MSFTDDIELWRMICNMQRVYGSFGTNIQVIRPGQDPESAAGKLDRIPQATPGIMEVSIFISLATFRRRCVNFIEDKTIKFR